jgi:uncharacterized protein GlcG (DUF336 family)
MVFPRLATALAALLFSLSLPAMAQTPLPNEGGVPIVVEGKLIGAIGVSGGSVEQDGQVAKAGASSIT